MDDGLLQGLVGFGSGFMKGMNDAEDRKYKRMEFEAKQKSTQNEMERRQADKEMDNFFKMQMLKATGAKPTEAQKAVDTTFGKEYADYTAMGGRAGVEKNLGLLEEAAGDLDAPGDISGGMSGLLPEVGQDYVNPKLAATRDKIRSAIQSTLKQVLGGQYTEREGQAIFSRAFNPRLSDEENARRVRAELSALQSMAGDKEGASRYYEQNGTLRGFKPSIKRGGPSAGGQPAGNKPRPKTVIQNGVTYTLNPATGEYE